MQAAQYSRATGPGYRVRPDKENLNKKPRRPDLTAQSSSLPPGRIFLVLAIVVGCLGILWPRIFSPLLFGEAPTPTYEEAVLSDPALKERGRRPPQHERKTPPLPVRTIDKEWKGRGGPMPGLRPTMGGPGIQPPEPRGGATLGMLMPMYTIGIIVFFVYTTFKVMNKNKEEDDDEVEVDEKLLAESIKYDEEYYNKLIKQNNMDDRVPMYPPQENTSPSTNLISQNHSEVENLLEEEELTQNDSEKECHVNGEFEKACRDEGERAEDDKFEAVKVEDDKFEAVKVNPEKVSSKSLTNDPRDLEIQLLKARLEQTEAALERIVAHMGSVTSRLAMQDLQLGNQKHCCTNTGEEIKSK